VVLVRLSNPSEQSAKINQWTKDFAIHAGIKLLEMEGDIVQKLTEEFAEHITSDDVPSAMPPVSTRLRNRQFAI
jgi:hypothetical protein